MVHVFGDGEERLARGGCGRVNTVAGLVAWSGPHALMPPRWRDGLCLVRPGTAEVCQWRPAATDPERVGGRRVGAPLIGAGAREP